MSERVRSLIVLIVAFTLCVVLATIAFAAAFGVELTELTRDTAIGVLGALAGALVTYLVQK